MIRKWFVLLAVLVCLILLFSCSQFKNDTAVTTENTDEIFCPNTYYDTTSVESPETEFDAQSSWAASEMEPPLSEEELAMAVPDFLTEEQQLLYRRASNVYSHLFGVSTTFVEYRETLGYTFGEYEYFENSYGWKRLISQGRYQYWDDFSKLVFSVFTEKFFNEKNDMGSNEFCYVEYNDKLSFIDSIGSGAQFYNYNFQDEFELVSMSDSEIVFNVIGHYSQIHPQEGESYDERDARCAESWESIDKFTIRMVMTEFGWRFDEFYDPAIDERTDMFIDNLGWH